MICSHVPRAVPIDRHREIGANLPQGKFSALTFVTLSPNS